METEAQRPVSVTADDMEKKRPSIAGVPGYVEGAVVEKNVEGVVDGLEVNASGHTDELQRQYSIWQLCGLALTIDNAWVALGGSLYVSVCKFYSQNKVAT
jgi:hypothetical protein